MAGRLWTNLFITLRALIVTTTLEGRRRLSHFNNISQRIRLWNRNIQDQNAFNDHARNRLVVEEDLSDNRIKRATRKLGQGLLSIGVIGLKVASGIFLPLLSLVSDE